MTPTTPTILLTIDVEDWFQVENFKKWIPFESWSSYELRVEKNTHRLLDLFDSIKTDDTVNSTRNAAEKNSAQQCNTPPTTHNKLAPWNSDEVRTIPLGRSAQQLVPNIEYPMPNTQYPVPNTKIKGTFFVLAWLAERLPHLVREIHARGHEVASHGYNHRLCYDMSPEHLRRDLVDSKNLLEDITGDSVYGYRAPNFSINEGVLKAIEACGYVYDSSYNSFTMHGRYGKISLNGDEKRGIAIPVNQKSAIENRQLYELPVSNLRLGGRVLPWAGGGYFRLIPFAVFKWGVKTLLRQDHAYVFYLHPWEIDPEQPQFDSASRTRRIRHYVNLRKTYSKLQELLRGFSHCRFATCSDYLKDMTRFWKTAVVKKGSNLV